MSANSYLILRLAGVMMSWGKPGRKDIKQTFSMPSKSAIIGLIMNAMGRERDDTECISLLSRLKLSVFNLKPGTLLTDYQTVGAKSEYSPDSVITVEGMERLMSGKNIKDSNRLQNIVIHKEYICDSEYIAILEGNGDTIGTCRDALERPVRSLFLGSKCCIPSEPVLVKIATTEEDAMEFIKTEAKRLDLKSIDYVCDTTVDNCNDMLMDMPIQFGQMINGYRQRMVEFGTVDFNED